VRQNIDQQAMFHVKHSVGGLVSHNRALSAAAAQSCRSIESRSTPQGLPDTTESDVGLSSLFRAVILSER